MRKFGMVAALLLVAGLSAGQVFGNTLYFSTLGPGEGATPGNVDLTGANALTVGDSGTLHLWYDNTSGKISSMGLDVLSSSPAVLQGTADAFVNPALTIFPTYFRWIGVGLGTQGDLVTGINLVGGLSDPTNTYIGLDNTFKTFDPYYEVGAGQYVGSFDYQATAVGTTEIKLSGGSATIVGGGIGTPAAPSLFFGTGDAAVPVSESGGQYYIAGGSTSTLADAVIEVVPEPATLGLLALGGLALIRRR